MIRTGIADARKTIAALVRPSHRAELFYAWWWWRSWNRPHVTDATYLRALDNLPRESLGLDLGSRSRIKPNAFTLDVIATPGVDVVGDGGRLPFADGTFDFVWCNAVLEHVSHPWQVAEEIARSLKPGGLAVISVPFLENVHGWPHDYYRFTIQGLRVLFQSLEEVKVGVSAGPGQVLPDLVQYYCGLFSELQQGSLLANVAVVLPGSLVLPFRLLDEVLQRRPTYWKWARGYYFIGRRPSGAPRSK